MRFHGLVVRTLDSESSNPSSSLGGTFRFLLFYFWQSTTRAHKIFQWGLTNVAVGFEAIQQASGYHPFLCLRSAHKHSSLRGEGERMAITLFSFAAPHQTLCTRRSFTNCNSRFHSSTTLIQYPSKYIIIPLSSSSSSSSTSVMEDGPSPSSDALPATEDVDELPLSGCKGCGREEIENGCNGRGKNSRWDRNSSRVWLVANKSLQALSWIFSIRRKV
ncbi:hypothetical protein OIU84_003932 [Salix udensis]|uniref:Uncharacterized protein n=1 Tax=Salix udensis TaxID=889485 RepID=A0AAD6P3V1_9ROSI|nr:hypothetical protein OIU84_003932 [Salix udensis]